MNLLQSTPRTLTVSDETIHDLNVLHGKANNIVPRTHFYHCSTCVSHLNLYSRSLYMGIFLSLRFKLLPAIQVPKLEKRIAIDARKSDDGEKLYMLSV